MSMITRIILWLWVMFAGLLFGGAIYETLVILPLWGGSPPESVMQWPHGVVQISFFGWVTPCYGALSLLLLALSFRAAPNMRKWALVAGLSGVVVLVWTFLYFVPILQMTEANRGVGLTGEEITRLVSQWRSWNFLRMAILFGGWISGLKAFSSS
jgi:hypothetical protein